MIMIIMCITRWKHPAGTPAIWQTSQTLPNLFKPTVTAQSIFSQSCKISKCQATRLILGNIDPSPSGKSGMGAILS